MCVRSTASRDPGGALRVRNLHLVTYGAGDGPPPQHDLPPSVAATSPRGSTNATPDVSPRYRAPSGDATVRRQRPTPPRAMTSDAGRANTGRDSMTERGGCCATARSRSTSWRQAGQDMA